VSITAITFVSLSVPSQHTVWTTVEPVSASGVYGSRAAWVQIGQGDISNRGQGKKFPVALPGEEGVTIQPGETRGFLIFGSNASSIGYGASGQNTGFKDENLEFISQQYTSSSGLFSGSVSGYYNLPGDIEYAVVRPIGGGDICACPPYPSSAYGFLSARENAVDDTQVLHLRMVDPLSQRAASIICLDDHTRPIGWVFHPKMDCHNNGSKSTSTTGNLQTMLNEAVKLRGQAVHTSGSVKMSLPAQSSWTKGTDAKTGMFVRVNHIDEEAVGECSNVVFRDNSTELPESCAVRVALPATTSIRNSESALPLGFTATVSVKTAKTSELATLLSVSPDSKAADSGLSILLTTKDFTGFVVTVANHATGQSASATFQAVSVANSADPVAITLVQSTSPAGLVSFEVFVDSESVFNSAALSEACSLSGAHYLTCSGVFAPSSSLTFCSGMNGAVSNLGFWRFALDRNQIQVLSKHGFAAFQSEFGVAGDPNKEEYVLSEQDFSYKNIRVLRNALQEEVKQQIELRVPSFAELKAGDSVKITERAIMESMCANPASQWSTAFSNSTRNDERLSFAGRMCTIYQTDAGDNTVEVTFENDRCWFTPECLLVQAEIPISGTQNHSFETLQNGAETFACLSLAGCKLNVDRLVQSGKALKAYTLTMEMGFSALPASRTPVLNFAKNVLSVEANGKLVLFGRPINNAPGLEAGVLSTVVLAWNSKTGYGYLTLDGTVLSYFQHKLNGVIPTTFVLTEVAVRRILLKDSIASLLGKEDVGTDETDCFSAMKFQKSWATQACDATDGHRSLATEWIMSHLTTLTEDHQRECKREGYLKSLNNLLALGYPRSWCVDALDHTSLSPEILADGSDSVAASLLQQGLSYLLQNIDRLTAASETPVLVRPTISGEIGDVSEPKTKDASASFKLLADDDQSEAGPSPAVGSSDDHHSSFYSEALTNITRDIVVDTPQICPKPPRELMLPEDKRTEEGKTAIKKYNKSKALFVENHMKFLSTRLMTESSLCCGYARMAMVNVLKALPQQPLFQNGFAWLIRVMEHSSIGLEIIRQHLIAAIVCEAPLLFDTPAPTAAQGLLLSGQTPFISQLIREALYQLLVTSKLKGIVEDEQKAIDGCCPNPRLALFLIDMFAYVTGDLADTKPTVLADQLRHLRAHFFNPVVVGLMFEAIPNTNHNLRISFVKMLASLVLHNTKAKSTFLIHFEPQRFMAMKALMVKLQKKSSSMSDFLRALVELNVSLEDQIEAQEQRELHDTQEKNKAQSEQDTKDTSGMEEKEAPKIHRASSISGIHNGEMFWPRCQYSSLDDTNGAIYFIGSGCGLTAFTNPVKTEKVNVTVSASRSDLNMENFLGNNLNDSHYVEGTASSPPWFVVHLGNWYVRPYCYRMKGQSANHLRNWELQGQSASGSWVTLNEHVEDQSFSKKDEICIWPLFMVAELYNSFRIIMTGPNSDGTFKMNTGGFEVYGQMVRVPDETHAASAPVTVNQPDAVLAAPVFHKVPNPQWFTDIHDTLRMFQYFSSNNPALLPASYPQLDSNISLSRRCWAELAALMTVWSSKNNDAVPDPAAINVSPSGLPHASNLDNASLPNKEKTLVTCMEILTKFNLQVAAVMGFINFNLPPNRSALADGFRTCCDLVFYNSKKARWKAALDATVGAENRIEMSIDPMRAASFAESGDVDEKASELFWGQVYSLLKDKTSSMFRISFGQRAFRANYSGMKSIDAGGPYRDCIEHMMMDLQSRASGIFLPSPNQIATLGENRDAWVPNPDANSRAQLRQYEFLGKMMGLSLRTRNLLNLKFPSIVWKPLVGSPVDMSDVEAIDVLSSNILKQINHPDAKSLPSELFNESMADIKFTVVDSAGKTRPLCPGGEQKSLTSENCHEYSAMVQNYRINEFRKQTAAIRQGLGKVVPLEALCLFSWKELEIMVCGRGFASEDVDLLKRNTEFSGFNQNDQMVEWFWEIMKNDFDDEQRGLYLVFAWGRSRLPSTAAEFDTKHKFHSRGGGDDTFPMGHTCFFQTDFPRYSSKEIFRQRLLTAITMCGVIDGD